MQVPLFNLNNPTLKKLKALLIMCMSIPVSEKKFLLKNTELGNKTQTLENNPKCYIETNEKKIKIEKKIYKCIYYYP